MEEGYIYCFYNPAMPDLFKIGEIHTEGKTPLDRANELSNTSVPFPFEVKLAKKVINPRHKENILHKLLEQYTIRVNKKREFFKVSFDEVYNFFELVDGEYWINNDIEIDNISEKESSQDYKIIGCRDMNKCFYDKQEIRHNNGKDDIWNGYYDKSCNKIIFEKNQYSFNNFVKEHYKKTRPERTSNANAWRECECLIKGKWVSTYNLDEIDEDYNPI